jgi:hypothetical protein
MESSFLLSPGVRRLGFFYQVTQNPDMEVTTLPQPQIFT